MSDYIPTELVDDILVRLPVDLESLIRFTSVCKSWYSIITSPSFIAKHLNHSKRRPENLLLATYTSIDKRERYLLCRGDEKFGDELDELESPLSTSLGRKIIVGSCNGLVCMIDNATSPPCIILWNPLIRKSVTLPMPISLPHTPHPQFVLGFGAHPPRMSTCWCLFFTRGWMYSSGNFLPRLSFTPKGQDHGDPSLLLVIQIALRVWIAYRLLLMERYIGLHSEGEWGGGLSSLIMSLKMGSQAFSQILMPAALVITSSLGVSILSYGESLAVLCYGQPEDGTCGMWVMKEYGVAESWAKLYNINHLGVLYQIVGFRKNGEVLLLMSDNYKRLLCYDCKTKTLTNTGYTGSSDAFTADTFMESLVLVKP